MRAIALTVYRRPQYLRQVLESLKQNTGLDQYTLFIGAEPVDAQVIKICQDIDFIKTDLKINPKVLGVRDNPFQTMQRAFDSGADLVWQMEDDVVLSPDASRLIDQYYALPQKEKYLCLNLYNPDSTDDRSSVVPSKRFSALSMAITRKQWDTYFKPNYHKDARGWDWSIDGLLKSTPLNTLLPSLSRSHHIGREGGTHYRPKEHDHLYVDNLWYQGDEQLEFHFNI